MQQSLPGDDATTSFAGATAPRGRLHRVRWDAGDGGRPNLDPFREPLLVACAIALAEVVSVGESLDLASSKRYDGRGDRIAIARPDRRSRRSARRS